MIIVIIIIIIIMAADYLFQPIAVEILGPINESASDFLSLLAKKKSANILATSGRLHFCSSARAAI